MIAKWSKLVLSLCCFLYTFYILCHLILFLSKRIDYDEKAELLEENNQAVRALWNLLKDMGLLSIFIVQHSVMASDSIKDLYAKFKLEDIERSIYNASSAVALNILICYWVPVPWLSLWNFNDWQGDMSWYVMCLAHVVGWIIVYVGCFMMDVSELAGLKQVIYKLSGRPNPMALKSSELQRYLTHMRHPSFTGFLLILWIYPLMSIDRFMMASLLTAYMALMWTIDMDDYNYHLNVIAKKEIEIKYKKY